MKNQIGKKVIIRADRAGVFFGTLSAKEGDEVQLTNARKIHYWDGAAAIEQLSVTGSSKPNDCRITMMVDELTIMQVIQIIPLTKESIANLENISAWKK
jgi:hypothetical protein